MVSSIYDISNQAFRFPDDAVDKIWVKVKLDEGKAEENRVYKAVVIADKQPTYKKAWLKVGSNNTVQQNIRTTSRYFSWTNTI